MDDDDFAEDGPVLTLENKVIDKLTKFTWWFEVKFNKDNVYLANFVSNIFLLASSLFLMRWSFYFFKEGYLLSLIAVVLSLFILYILTRKIQLEESIIFVVRMQYPQGCPNPCRYLLKQSRERRSEFFQFFLWSFVAFLEYGDFIFSAIFNIACIVFMGSVETFLLACDSLPKEEKEKRKKVLEIKKHVLSPSS